MTKAAWAVAPPRHSAVMRRASHGSCVGSAVERPNRSPSNPSQLAGRDVSPRPAVCLGFEMRESAVVAVKLFAHSSERLGKISPPDEHLDGRCQRRPDHKSEKFFAFAQQAVSLHFAHYATP
jgi:hypothetical protein